MNRLERIFGPAPEDRLHNDDPSFQTASYRAMVTEKVHGERLEAAVWDGLQQQARLSGLVPTQKIFDQVIASWRDDV